MSLLIHPSQQKRDISLISNNLPSYFRKAGQKPCQQQSAAPGRNDCTEMNFFVVNLFLPGGISGLTGVASTLPSRVYDSNNKIWDIVIHPGPPTLTKSR